MNNRKLIILILFVLCSIALRSQNMLAYVDVSGVVKDGSRPMNGVNIEIYANNTLLKIEQTDITGKFRFKLELNRKYRLKFVKEFYVSKMVDFSTQVMENELGYWLYKFTVELFPKVEGLNFSFLSKEPVAIVAYRERYGEFDYDRTQTRKMHKKIEAMLAGYEVMRKNKYNDIIKQADRYDKINRPILAINNYREAAVLDKYNEYPLEQIERIDKKLRKSSPEYFKYLKHLNTADSLFRNHMFSEALTHYKMAQNQISGSRYTQYMITRIDSLNNKFDPSYIRLQKYREFLSTGDQYVSEANYAKAIEAYNKALSIQKTDSYALKQINYLKSQINKKQGKAEKERRYEEYIILADRYFEDNSYSAARLVYLKSLEVQPNQKYPAVQIDKIDRILHPNEVNMNTEEFENFTVKDRDKAYLEELALKYKKRKTIEYFDLPGKRIQRVILVENKIATEYIEVSYNYGTFYFRNGQNISRAIFISETNK